MVTVAAERQAGEPLTLAAEALTEAVTGAEADGERRQHMTQNQTN